MPTRRRFLGGCAAALSSTLVPQAAAPSPAGEPIVVDPKPLFDISPYLYMQFMEPLGVTDSSVEAAWDYDRDDWREDFIATVKDLAPDVVRYGGLFCRYYKWREGVGPAERRPWMRNYVWGGKETNRVGTHEFAHFCRRVGAEPLYCVNFLSDGRPQYRSTRARPPTGSPTRTIPTTASARGTARASLSTSGSGSSAMRPLTATTGLISTKRYPTRSNLRRRCASGTDRFS